MPFLLKYETKQRNGIINILEQCKKFTTSTAQQNMLQHLDQPHSIDFFIPQFAVLFPGDLFCRKSTKAKILIKQTF